MTEVLEHKHLIVTAKLGNPPTNTKLIKVWMKSLVDIIGMKVLMGPYAVYSKMEGNRGLTAVTIIETSHITFHAWDEVEPALMQLDVYSCQGFDIRDVFTALAEFEPANIDYYYIDRKDNLSMEDKKNKNWFERVIDFLKEHING